MVTFVTYIFFGSLILNILWSRDFQTKKQYLNFLKSPINPFFHLKQIIGQAKAEPFKRYFISEANQA